MSVSLIAAAHLYSREPGASNYNEVPTPLWDTINFHNIDQLYVSPFVVNAKGLFDLADVVAQDKAQCTTSMGTLAARVNWIVKTARSQNPKIKILAQQFWGADGLANLLKITPLPGKQLSDVIAAYASSVSDAIETYDLDGYDLDCEDGCEIDEVPQILNQIRVNFNTLGKKLGRTLYVTISPSKTTTLDNKTYPLADSVDFVNARTYDGGSVSLIGALTGLGVPSQNILFGLKLGAAGQKPDHGRGTERCIY